MPKILPGLLATAVALVVVGCSGQPVAPAPTVTPVTTVPAFSGPLALARLRMISATTGWALTVPGDGNGLGHPVRTTDGGAHWEAMGPPSNLTSPNVDAVDFHDALQAWMLVCSRG